MVPRNLDHSSRSMQSMNTSTRQNICSQQVSWYVHFFFSVLLSSSSHVLSHVSASSISCDLSVERSHFLVDISIVQQFVFGQPLHRVHMFLRSSYKWYRSCVVVHARMSRFVCIYGYFLFVGTYAFFFATITGRRNDTDWHVYYI